MTGPSDDLDRDALDLAVGRLLRDRVRRILTDTAGDQAAADAWPAIAARLDRCPRCRWLGRCLAHPADHAARLYRDDCPPAM